MAEEPLDLVADFVGDYIYQSPGRIISCGGTSVPNPSLVDYRNRYAQYRTDPDLQRMHMLVPWLMTGTITRSITIMPMNNPSILTLSFWRGRAAAYQAYYEHMPLRSSARPHGPHVRLYDCYPFGTLLAVYVAR